MRIFIQSFFQFADWFLNFCKILERKTKRVKNKFQIYWNEFLWCQPKSFETFFDGSSTQLDNLRYWTDKNRFRTIKCHDLELRCDARYSESIDICLFDGKNPLSLCMINCLIATRVSVTHIYLIFFRSFCL